MVLISFKYPFIFCYTGPFCLFLLSTIYNLDHSHNMILSSFMETCRLFFLVNQLYAMSFLGVKHTQSLFWQHVTYEALQMECAICLISKDFKLCLSKI